MQKYLEAYGWKPEVKYIDNSMEKSEEQPEQKDNKQQQPGQQQTFDSNIHEHTNKQYKQDYQ